MAEEKYCDQHNDQCTNMALLKRDVDDMKDEMQNFKQFVYNKFDDVNRNYNTLNDKMVRIEVIIEEKFKNITDKIQDVVNIVSQHKQDSKEDKKLFKGQFTYPLLAAITSGLIVGVVVALISK